MQIINVPLALASLSQVSLHRLIPQQLHRHLYGTTVCDQCHPFLLKKMKKIQTFYQSKIILIKKNVSVCSQWLQLWRTIQYAAWYSKSLLCSLTTAALVSYVCLDSDSRRLQRELWWIRYSASVNQDEEWPLYLLIKRFKIKQWAQAENNEETRLQIAVDKSSACLPLLT